MQYEAPKFNEKDNPNIPHDTHHGREIRAMLIYLAITVVVIWALVEVAVRAMPYAISLPREKQWFSFVGKELIADKHTQQDPQITALAARLGKHMNLPDNLVTVYISEQEIPNAYATFGGNVVLYRGLLKELPSEESVAAVLAHEMAHIGNGDMVTLTLIQGIVNTFVVFFARIIASAVAQSRDGENNQGIYFAVSMVLQVLFGFLASIIVMWFSRQREYRADAGAAKLVGPAKMIAALQRLKGGESRLPQNMTAMGIASESKDSLLSTHPSLDNRIARLQMM